MSDSPTTRLPARPSLSQLRKRAKDLLHDARSGDAAATAKLAAVLPESKRENALLAHAQLAIAREHGFPSWAKLVHHVESIAGDTTLPPLIRPLELAPGRTWDLADGSKVASRPPIEME